MTFDDDLIQEVGPALAYWIGQWTASIEALKKESKSFRERTAEDMKEIKKRLEDIESGAVQARQNMAVAKEQSGGHITWESMLKEVAMPVLLMGGGALLGFILANLS